MSETLGEIIRRLRISHGMSQAGLAWAAGVKAASINNYESDYRRPDLETLSAIADALDVSLDEFRIKSEPNADLTDEQLARSVRYEVWSRMSDKEKAGMIYLMEK